uniref:Apple domain-containing protein n=1 Tax=Parastrongyloides trichosuri TaxID=131310 RepID=A0A0N5A3M1_PARTI
MMKTNYIKDEENIVDFSSNKEERTIFQSLLQDSLKNKKQLIADLSMGFLSVLIFLTKMIYTEGKGGKLSLSFSTTLILLLLTANCLESRGEFCFNFPKNLTINGADYRQIYKRTQRSCAKACLEDFCCMAYEWIENEEGICTHKTRSLNGTVEEKANAHFGLCLDLDDYDRDKFADHIIKGNELARISEVTLNNCASYCLNFGDNYKIFSWHSDQITDYPIEEDKESNVKGTCLCLDNIEEIQLKFGSTSGLLR